MFRLRSRSIVTGLCLLATSACTFAHLSYSGRDFGSFTGLGLQSATITGQSVPTNWGWADGTDGDFGHTHRVRFFRFTLENTAPVTISFMSLNATAMMPAFSLYSGLAHTAPLDYDSELTFQYLATLPGLAKEGAFNALDTWKMGNDASKTYDDFTTFTYIGNAADGTATNFGGASGINGDGVADGAITRTFLLGPGSYTLAVGGANYAGQGSGASIGEGGNEGADTVADGVTGTVTVVPEPASGVVAAASVLLLLAQRRKRS